MHREPASRPPRKSATPRRVRAVPLRPVPGARSHGSAHPILMGTPLDVTKGSDGHGPVEWNRTTSVSHIALTFVFLSIHAK